MADDRSLSRRKHAKKRAMERYDGVELTRYDIQWIEGAIRRGIAIHLLDESHTKSHFLVLYKDKYLRVVYSKLHKTLITALPPFEIDEFAKVLTMDRDLIKKINLLIYSRNGGVDGAIVLEKISSLHLVFIVKIGEQWIKVHYNCRKQTIFDP